MEKVLAYWKRASTIPDIASAIVDKMSSRRAFGNSFAAAGTAETDN
jgi:hypothetical protein